MILPHWSRWQNSHSFQREQTQALVQETRKLLSSSGYGNLMETYGILKKTQDQNTQIEAIWFVLIEWELLSNHAWVEWKSERHLFEANNIAIHSFISEWNKSWNSYLLCWAEYFEKFQCRNKEILNFSIFTTEIFSYGQTEVFCLTHRSCVFDEEPSISFEKREFGQETLAHKREHG